MDVRDVITGEILPYNKFINRYVVRAEPNRAILEVDYFIKMIEACEQNRDEEIDRIEAGQVDPSEQEQEKEAANEWDNLQNLNNEEYYTGTQENFGVSGIRLRPHPRVIGGNVSFRF